MNFINYVHFSACRQIAVYSRAHIQVLERDCKTLKASFLHKSDNKQDLQVLLIIEGTVSSQMFLLFSALKSTRCESAAND